MFAINPKNETHKKVDVVDGCVVFETVIVSYIKPYYLVMLQFYLNNNITFKQIKTLTVFHSTYTFHRLITISTIICYNNINHTAKLSIKMT